MTLLDISNQIIASLIENPVFSTEQFASIKVEPQYADKRDDLIRSTFPMLVSAGIVTRVGTDFWMLTQPLGAMGQDIHLSAKTAAMIADVINTYLAAKCVDGDHANALNISEEEIAMLLQIISDVISTDPEDESGAGSSDER